MRASEAIRLGVLQVGPDRVADARVHLDHHLPAVRQAGRMDLPDRGRRHGPLTDPRERLLDGAFELRSRTSRTVWKGMSGASAWKVP